MWVSNRALQHEDLQMATVEELIKKQVTSCENRQFYTKINSLGNSKITFSGIFQQN